MHNFKTWIEGVEGKKIYLVVDASPDSMLDDILMGFDLSNPRDIASYIMGSTPLDSFLSENPTFHMTHPEALADAQLRLDNPQRI